MYKPKQSWHRLHVQAETVLAQKCTSRNSPGIDCMYKLKQSWHRNVQAETVLAHCIYKLKQSWHTQRVQADSPETETARTQHVQADTVMAQTLGKS